MTRRLETIIQTFYLGTLISHGSRQSSCLSHLNAEIKGKKEWQELLGLGGFSTRKSKESTALPFARRTRD